MVVVAIVHRRSFKIVGIQIIVGLLQSLVIIIMDIRIIVIHFVTSWIIASCFTSLIIVGVDVLLVQIVVIVHIDLIGIAMAVVLVVVNSLFVVNMIV